MMFKDKYVHKFYAFALAAAFALTLAGCGGGGGSTTQTPTDMPDPQAACEADGGEYRDGTCVTAAELTAERMAAQRMAIDTAIDRAETAVAGIDDESTDSEVTAANMAVAAARTAISDAADLPQAEKDANTGTVDAIANRLTAALESRTAAMDDADRAADMAMAATAAKLYTGIDTVKNPTGDPQAASPAILVLNAGYNDVDTPNAGDAVDTRILVAIGAGDAANTFAPPRASHGQHVLSEDKKTTVADNHGWEGKRYIDPPRGDMVEAMVWSNVGEPTMGAKFNSGTGDGNVGFELDGTSGETPVLSTLTGYAARVDSPSFDQSAGTKEFKLPTNTVRVMLSGTYHGVSGTYYCTPAANSTCAARKAATGFELGSSLDADNMFTAGGWTFKPTNPEARVTEAKDTSYASYGWWLWTAENGKTVLAHVFTDEKGTVPPAAGINALNGTATYVGGAAGKYALISAPGGRNDAGHFTARATLEADFTNNTAETAIIGTIDQFIGADGESRDWEVELNATQIGDTGLIGEASPSTGDKRTVWTIGETAAAAAGQWDGKLLKNGDDGVPQVATGTFTAEYSTSGKMVGAFGANKQ